MSLMEQECPGCGRGPGVCQANGRCGVAEGRPHREEQKPAGHGTATVTSPEPETQPDEQRLRRALVGDDPLDPRWTWLPGVIERLEVHAAADEDPGAMYDAAAVLQRIYDDLRPVLAPTPQAPHG